MDQALCRRLLDIALRNGGDHADLFFEYRAGDAFTFSDDTLKAVSRHVSAGVGVRVQPSSARRRPTSSKTAGSPRRSRRKTSLAMRSKCSAT
ncbi:hypothetical protein KEG38_27480 [Polyangium jinanense]|uniref:hypothetical protein n=1 Tax=Polyangium jinanense TaxID=2829994 RepID=UPI00234029A0|nr:hypothetical protein [Polyangium jinanense]MDC3957631.1 hypothetical protein [Polyangium jinanense]